MNLKSKWLSYFNDNNGSLKGYEMSQEDLAASLYNMFPENDEVVYWSHEGSNNDQLNSILNKYE